MGRNKTMMKNNTLYDTKTGVEIVRFSSQEEDNNYYATVVMCGHCGNAFFIPILFGFRCRNIDEAHKLARNTARVKRNKKECILSMEQIDETTFRLIELINKYDGYLQPSYIGYDDSDIEDRKIIMQPKLRAILESEENTTKRKTNGYQYVKTADMYPSEFVLQKAFAPTVRKNESKGRKLNLEESFVYSYPNKVKISDFLEDYLTVETFKKGIMKKKVNIISMYYQLYGDNNKLGIKYKDGVFEVVDQFKKKVCYKVDDVKRKYVDNNDNGYLSREEKQDPYKIVSKIAGEGHAKSGLERFNKRFNKSASIKNNQPEPGEEE